MKWLKELKADMDGQYDYDSRMIAYHENTIFRLIAIAEKAERCVPMDFEPDQCPFNCSYINMDGHDKDCPYSDEWRKE